MRSSTRGNQSSEALLTDFYQLTMAYGYWKLHRHEQPAVFHLMFRKNPFNSNHALACGLASVVDYLQDWRFKESDLDYLASLKNKQQTPLFPEDFLNYLSELRFTGDVDAIPEGTVVFAHEPLIRLQGPLLQCQLLETPLLNRMNFQTLIATKSSRICRAAQGDPVIEFGMRRAQGPDGGLSASRAAYIGGCVATSNTFAGKCYGIPVRGTHAHSWVTAFPSEKQAFTAYAELMPDQCVLLVDTYDTLNGVKKAIEVGLALREKGHDLLGIRLDSGNMADLSIKARTLLDEAGFENTDILASNSLDEYMIKELKEQGAKISSWGVGTNLVTSYDQPALDGVYKLSALQDENKKWHYTLKLSEQIIKISNPGIHQVRRFFRDEQYIMDVIYDVELGISDNAEMILLDNPNHKIKLNDYDAFVDLLEPVFRNGKWVQKEKSIHQIRSDARNEVERFYNAQGEKKYSVGLEKNLYDLKNELIKIKRKDYD